MGKPLSCFKVGIFHNLHQTRGPIPSFNANASHPKIDPFVVRDRFSHPEIVKVSKAAGVILGLWYLQDSSLALRRLVRGCFFCSYDLLTKLVGITISVNKKGPYVTSVLDQVSDKQLNPFNTHNAGFTRLKIGFKLLEDEAY